MVAAIPLVILGGGVAYVATQTDIFSPTASNVAPSGAPLGGSGFSPGATVNQLNGGYTPGKIAMLAGVKQQTRKLVIGSTSYTPSPVASPAGAGHGSQVDGAVQEKLAVVESYAKAVYTNMDQEGRKAGAKALNKEFKLDPPLDEESSWAEISAAAGGAIGGAAGAWIGGPIGAKIGAIVGAYLGTKIEEFLSKHADEIKAWFEAKWTDIKDWVSGVAGDIYDGAEDAVDAVGDWFSETF